MNKQNKQTHASHAAGENALQRMMRRLRDLNLELVADGRMKRLSAAGRKRGGGTASWYTSTPITCTCIFSAGR